MSDPDRGIALAGGRTAKDVRAAAAIWLERRQRGDWNPKDQSELDIWLAQSMAHRTAYWRVADAWTRADRLKVLGTPMRERPAQTQHKSFTPWFFRIAAAAVVVGAVGAAVMAYVSKPAQQTYGTTIGGRETLAFADGTEIDLNTDTVLRASVTREHRQVWLDKGEAYFRIKHDAAHPFVVIAGGHRVTDLGTQFIVRRDGNRVEVSLMEGRAQVDAPSSAVRPTTLKPGDVLVATANTMSVTQKPPRMLSDQLGWRQGVIVFRHTTLADAAFEFNRYSNRKLTVADGDVGRLTVVGTFRANDMTSFVEVARTIFGLKVERRGDETVLSR